jgi:FkbM family methyltransferase
MNLLFKLSGLFYKLHQFFFKKARAKLLPTMPLSEINKESWYKDNKEKTLRYEYPLNSDSTVIDVGGYEGDFASEIFSRYQSCIFVFEPVKRYVNYLNERFSQNNSIKIIPYGLGDKNETLNIHVMEEASSYNRSETIHKKGEEEVISIMDVVDFFNENEIKYIDLIKINIEGGEYDLLDKMIESGYIKICKNIQVQFHDFYPDFQKRYDCIKKELSKTHLITYNYPFVWENWQLK